MDPLDRLALNESLRAYGVSAAVPHESYFVSPHPIDELLAAARPQLAKPLVVLAADVGAPEHFFLDGFDFLPVVFSTRYVGLTYRLSSLLLGDLGNMPDLLARMSQSMALEAMAEFFLLAQKDEFACHAFCRGRFLASGGGSQTFIIGDSRSLLGVGTDLWEIERQNVSKSYAVDMFLGFAHELGHAIDRSRARPASGPPWCMDDLITNAVAYFAAQAPGLIGQSYREDGPADVLSVKRLRTEIAADVTGCRLLAQAMRGMHAHNQTPEPAEPDLAKLVAAISLHFITLEFVNTCWRWAQLATMTPDAGTQRAARLQQPISFAVRKTVLTYHLPVIAADLARTDGSPAPIDDDFDVGEFNAETRKQCTALWNQAAQNIASRLQIFLGGLEDAAVAIQSWSFDDQQETMRWFLNENPSVEFQRDHFLTLARSFGVSNGRVNRLRELLGHNRA